jgi:hypothetical protein
MEFHVHIDASLLTVGAMLSQNLIGKSDQPIVYAYKLLNRVEHNYSTIEREVLTMVFALHKFRHYLLGNKPIFLCKSYGVVLSGQQTKGFEESS